ncbi:MAG TPA: hypothetical protein VIK75_10295 [Calditerricola sp.]
MADIIDLNAFRAGRPKPTPTESYFVRVDCQDGVAVSGAVLDTEGLSPTECRHVADDLERLARWLRAEAREREPDDDADRVATVAIHYSSRVRTWVSDDCSDAEHIAWLHERLEDAKETVKLAEGAA